MVVVDPLDAAGSLAGVILSDPVVAGGPLQFVAAKARSGTRQARDDVGRWRKIYYKLRRSQSSGGKMRDALTLVKKAEHDTEVGRLKPHQKIETVRSKVADLGLTQEVDERVSAKLIKDARDSARLMQRLEALGPDTMVSIGQLPQAIQDSIKDYLRATNLEPRITKHFGPFESGKVRRSVRDIVNLVDRVVIDQQNYQKGYDMERS